MAEDLESCIFVDIIAQYVEPMALGHSIMRVAKMAKAGKHIYDVHQKLRQDETYTEAISLEEIEKDFLDITKDTEFNKNNDQILKRGFALGILTKTSEEYYDMVIQPDYTINGDMVKMGMQFTDLAQQYVAKIIKEREPFEYGNNDIRLVNDMAFAYSSFQGLLEKHVQGKDTPVPSVDQAINETLQERNNIRQMLGDIYHNKTLLGKNIVAGAYGLLVIGCCAMANTKTLTEVPLENPAFYTALTVSFTNMLFPTVFKNTTFEDTLKHSPGLAAGIYTGFYLADKFLT